MLILCYIFISIRREYFQMLVAQRKLIQLRIDSKLNIHITPWYIICPVVDSHMVDATDVS